MSILSRIAIDWGIRCFPKQMNNIPERALRTVEEAIEFCQATGVPKDRVAKALDIVYDKPVGEPYQEMGGVLLTSAMACGILGWEPDEVLEMELRRVLNIPVEKFVKRNDDKIAAGLSVVEPDFEGGLNGFRR